MLRGRHLKFVGAFTGLQPIPEGLDSLGGKPGLPLQIFAEAQEVPNVFVPVVSGESFFRSLACLEGGKYFFQKSIIGSSDSKF